MIVQDGTLAARRRTLVVYHVDPTQFEIALAEACEQLGRPVERRGNLWVGGLPLYELEPFDSGQTVTLRWLADDHRLFEDVNRQVRGMLPSLANGHEATSRWFTTAAIGCLIVVVFCLVLLIYGLALVR